MWLLLGIAVLVVAAAIALCVSLFAGAHSMQKRLELLQIAVGLSLAAVLILAAGIYLWPERAKQAQSCPAAPALYEVYFPIDSAVPRWESAVALTGALQLLRGDPDVNVEIHGHADERGTDEYNRRLAQYRIEAVTLWLTGHGIPEDRMFVWNAGKDRPEADNRTEEGRARNCRVDIMPVCALAREAVGSGPAAERRMLWGLRGPYDN